MNAKKLVAGAAIGVVSAAALATAGAYYGYCEAFQRDEKRIAPIREIPEGELYGPYREKMLANIEKLVEAPYERVTVRSYDGL